MGIQRSLRAPVFNQHKLVFIAGIGEQVVLQATGFGQHQRLEVLIGLQLLLSLTGLNLDQDEKMDGWHSRFPFSTGSKE